MMTLRTCCAALCLTVLALGCGPTGRFLQKRALDNSSSVVLSGECTVDFKQMPKPFGLHIGMSKDEFAKTSPEIQAKFKEYREGDPAPYGYESGQFTFNSQGTRHTGVNPHRNYGISQLDHIEASFSKHRLFSYLIYYARKDDYQKARQEMIDYLEQLGAGNEPKRQYDLILGCKNVVVEFFDQAFTVRKRNF